VVTFICAVIYTFFIISNVFFFLIDHWILDANVRKIRSLSLAQLEIFGYIILTYVFRPNEFLEFFDSCNCCARFFTNTLSLDINVSYETEENFSVSGAYEDLEKQENE
jgi:hypothetical protein